MDEVAKLREEQRKKALDLVREYGWIDGAHHKQWVLDQVARALCTDAEYKEFRGAFLEIVNDETGETCDHWDEGIAP